MAHKDMNKIGLIDVDGRHYPNLALMKISAYHKAQGDQVEWVTIGNYDRIYMSKVFSFTFDYPPGLLNYGEIVKGGTGYNMDTLPVYIDGLCPDYSIYPKFKEAYGFLTRGCPNKCSWCIVPNKEGNIRPYMDIEQFLSDRKSAILMDNNVLASEHGLVQIEKIIRLKIKVDFNQGLDARIIAKDRGVAQLLSRVKWIRFLRMACDTQGQLPYVEQAIKNLNVFGFKSYRVFVYVLVKDTQDALFRVESLRELGVVPFAQPYRDYLTNKAPQYEHKRFARWVNHKAIFNSVKYENYQ